MSGPLNGAVGAEEFSTLLEKFAPLADKIAIAVSGGPDSMALAVCLQRWGKNPCIALIVDHGLRHESAAEAAQVKSRLESIGMQAKILRWSHGAINGRLHEKARAARYELLTDACRRLGIGDFFTAHHREDQAETILMRVAKGSGIEGLAGIPPVSIRNGTRILRPFLTLSKQRLLTTCENARIATVADPSNSSHKFARGRLRAVLPLLENEGMSVESLLSLGAYAAEAAAAVDIYAKDLLRDAAIFTRGGTIRIDRARFALAPRATAARALSLCLQHIHRADYPPERSGVAHILDAITDPSFAVTRSFYGCLISIGKSQILVLREPAAANENLSALPGKTVLWDGRWLVALPPDVASHSTLRALGNPPHELVDSLAPGLRRLMPQGRARASLPALWREGSLAAIPSFEEKALFRVMPSKQAFP